LIYNASGGLDQKVYSPQRMFLTPWQKLYIYPTKLQAAIYTQDSRFGEVKAADGILVTTNDNAQTVYDLIVYYRVRPEDVHTVFNAFGPIDIADIQTQHIRRFVKEAASAVGSDYDVFQLMTAKRAEACDKLKSRLEAELGKRGITIEHVFLVNPQPQGDVNNKITARVNAYTGLTTSTLRNQVAELDRQIAVVHGETEAKARSIVAKQSSAKSIEMQKLELEEEAVDAWNGEFSPYQLQPNQTVVINGGSGTTVVPQRRGRN